MRTSTQKYLSFDKLDEIYDLGLRLLYRPPAGNIEISIVAIHGLQALSPRAWIFTDAKTGKETNWLEDADMLPQAVPTAEIYAYNWEANFVRSSFEDVLEDHAHALLDAIAGNRHRILRDRPIIFIAACFGGLILAKALLTASQHSNPYTNIFLRTAGIVLIATPFQLSSVLRVTRWGASIGTVMDQKSSQAMVWSNRTIGQLKDDFDAIMTHPSLLPCYCYYETEETRALWDSALGSFSMEGDTILVGRESGTLVGHHQKGRAVSHPLMNKFKGPEDQDYQTMKEIIVDFVRGANSVVQDRLDVTWKPHIMIPYPKNQNFVGRKAELKTLLDSIPPLASPERCQITAIVGLAGMGKTQVALAAAYEVPKKDPTCSVFWVRADSKASFVTDYTRIGEALGLLVQPVDAVRQVNHKLEESRRRWLLVLDGVDEGKAFFREWYMVNRLPNSTAGSILLTTRDRDIVHFQRDASVLSLTPLGDPESLELLIQGFAGLGQHLDLIDHSVDTAKLLRLLAGHPLAITQTAGYIRRCQLTVEEYLQLWETNEQKMIDVIYQPSFTQGQIALDRIKESNPGLLECVQFIAQYSEKNIPISMMEKETNVNVDSVINDLTAYSLVTKPTIDSSYINVHPVVQLAMKTWLSREKELRLTAGEVIEGIKAHPVEEPGTIQAGAASQVMLKERGQSVTTPAARPPDQVSKHAPEIVSPRETREHDASTALSAEEASFSYHPGPVTMAGTSTTPGSKSDRIFSSRAGESTIATDAPTMVIEDGTSTVYSDTMTLPGSTKESYATELCEQLVLAILPHGSPQEAIQGLAEVLPEHLRAFALRFGSSYPGDLRDRGDIMAFVHKYREYISETFMDKYEAESGRVKEPENKMPLDDIMSMWYSHDEHIPGEFEPAGPGIGLMDSSDPDDDETASEGNRLPTARVDEEDATPVDDEELARRLPKLGAYRESILAAPAYRWLISDIERQLRLSSSSPSGSETIQREIFQAFPQVRHLSRSSPPRRSKIMYKMPWDPIAFCKDQEYSEEAPDALAWAITLTGSTSVAQALTSSQYLRQTWPSSGQDILELIQELLRGTPGIRVGKSLSDGTVVTAWFDTSNDSEQPHFTAEATGTAYTLAEIGEQLAWLGAALQSSPYPDGVTSMQAGIKTLWVIHDNSKFPGDGFLSEVLCGLEFKVCAPESNARTSGPNSNGECWHSLFRNPVLVRGFPIARRASELGSATGLEIPIHMMARLARSRVLNSFCGRTVLKGFSTLLVPTRRLDGVIVWHLIHDEYGDRVSYLECLQEPHIHQIPVREIQKARHILGWCSKARFLAGTASANYDVTSSRLPRARSGSLLQQASISGGQAISGGEPFSVGYKDSPPHISRMGYIRKLKWISRKFVVLWDEGTKRGWLLNGTTALLHLVRASLEHDSKDKFSSQFLFRVGDMEEAPPNATYESDSAIRVLLSDLNRKLRIYPEKDGYIQFEDRVEHIYGLLAQTIDHQAHALSSYNAQSSNVSRAHLEGWDFHDLASDMDPVHPRTFPLGTLGMAWIELARSIHAVTLVGRGFGDIMTPAKPSCTQWATLPMGKYYLAVSASDLMDIMDAVGDASTIPPRLTDNLLWLNTATMTPDGCCQGGGQCTEDHVDVVQVLLPPDINHASKKRYTCPPEDGAVVFGHNENVPWFWKETGHPVYGSPDRLDRPVLHSSSESGYGPSTEGESGSTRPTSPPSSVQGDMPAPAVALRVPLPATKVKLGRHALSINSYTVGIVCALPLELFAVRALFDVTHADKDGIVTPSDDSNHYALGEIGKHKVVAACLPDGQYGTNSAADVITNMKRTFTSVKFALLVGIGGGVPSSANDIRLGDVVVSRPTGTSPGVIQYDMGKVVEDGGFTQTGYLQPPPRFIMTALSNLRSDPHLSSTPLQESLEEISACSREYRYPGKGPDRLFTSDYPHDLALATCNSCDTRRLQPRRIRHDSKTNTHNPRIHYGTIASGNRVVRDAKFRDHWSKEANILCFEMEAAGIMNTLPCLVIRGICDYSDSHKNKVFQNYAAAAAASYAKLLLSYVKNATDPDGIVEGEIVEKRKHFKGLRRAFRGDLPFFSRS